MTVDDKAAWQAALDPVIDAALRQQRLAGVEVMLAQHGRLRYHRAAGWADREAGRRLQTGGLFRLASLSKLYTACAVLRLLARGELQLDAALADYLPSFQPRLAKGEAATISLRQLLSHCAGLGYGFLEPAGGGGYHAAGVSDGLDRVAIDLAENMRRLAAQPLWYPPGSGWAYSLASDVLGALLERVCGLPLPAVIAREVCVPLGLCDSAFHAVDAARLATPYVDAPRRPRRMAASETVQLLPTLAGVRFAPGRALDAAAFPSGGAGMVGSAADFLALLEALRQGGQGWLPPAWIAEMGRSQTGGLTLEGWPGWGFGLGFAVLIDPQLAGVAASPGSWRWLGAYGHSWLVDPARGLNLVACGNTAFESASGAFSQQLLAAVCQTAALPERTT